MRMTVKLPSLSNVALGSTATLNLPIGRTYDQIRLKLTDLNLDEVQNIELIANGKTFASWKDGAQVKFLNDYYGRPADPAGQLTFHFVRPEMADLTQRRMFALGTADLKTLTLRFDIPATTVAGTAPVVEAWAVQSEPAPMGVVTKIKRFPFASSVAGIKEIDNLPTGGARIMAIHALKGDIDKSEVEMNSVKVFDAQKGIAEGIQIAAGRTPQSSVASHLDWILEGDAGQALATKDLQDFRVRLDLATAGAGELIVEYMDGLAGI